MNILFYGSSYPPIPYGASRYFETLSRGLVRRGHSVDVVTAAAPGAGENETRDGVRVHRIGPSDRLRTAEAAREALRIAARVRADLIQGVEYLGECAPLLRERDRPPVCIKAAASISLRALRRSLAHLHRQRVFVTLACLRAWRQWRAESLCLRRADVLIAPSRRVFLELERQGMKLPARRSVLPNPVDMPPDWQNRESETPTMLFVGRLDFGKGVGYLPEIWARIRARAPSARLVIAGGDTFARGIGSVRQWLNRRFDGFHDSVRFTGQISRAALDEEYRRAWVVIVPSRWDSCSYVTLEAMARAKAIVVSPHGGMPELVEGTGAPVADPATAAFAEAIVDLLEDKERRRSLGALLRQRAAAEFAPERAVDAYVEFIESCGLGKRREG